MEAIFWMIHVLHDWIIIEHNGNYTLFLHHLGQWEEDDWFLDYGDYDHIDDVLSRIIDYAEERLGNYGIINAEAVFSSMKFADNYQTSSLEEAYPNIIYYFEKKFEEEMMDNEPDGIFPSEADMFVQHKVERGRAWYRHNKRTYYPKKH